MLFRSNEFGDTPEGQRALKLVRARAKAQLEWGKGAGMSFAKRFGKPEDVEREQRTIESRQRVIDQANKRLEPKPKYPLALADKTIEAPTPAPFIRGVKVPYPFER